MIGIGRNWFELAVFPPRLGIRSIVYPIEHSPKCRRVFGPSIICPLVFLLVLMGCKDAPQNFPRVSPPAPDLSANNSPTNQVRQIARLARQLVITNALVVDTNYLAYLARISPEAARLLPYFAESWGGYRHYYSATNLANQIADADHIVVSYWGSVLDPFELPVTMLLSGNAAKQVVRAVSCARFGHEVNPGWIFPNGEMQFYKSTNQLVSVRLVWDGFSEHEDAYPIFTDYSRVLGTLSDIGQAAGKE